MLFAHRRTLRKGRSFALAINFVGFLLFLGLATYLVFFQEKLSGIWFGKAVFIISALTLPVVMWWFIRLFGGTGEWNIQISETELIWQSPNNVGEKSFRVLIANIKNNPRTTPAQLRDLRLVLYRNI